MCGKHFPVCQESSMGWEMQCNGDTVLSREIQCLSACPVGLHLHVCSRECLTEDPYSYTKHTRDGYISLLHPLQPSLFQSAFKEIKTQYLGRFWSPYWNVLTWLHFRSQNQFIQQYNSLDDILQVGWRSYGHQALNLLGIRSSTTILLNLGSSSPPRPSSPPSLALTILWGAFTWEAEVPGELPGELSSHDRTWRKGKDMGLALCFTMTTLVTSLQKSTSLGGVQGKGKSTHHMKNDVQWISLGCALWSQPGFTWFVMKCLW